MSRASVGRLVSIVALGLMLGQGALAQKLGSPSVAVVSTQPLADPGSLFGMSGAVGSTLRFIVVGDTVGGIWGDGVYTSDSVLAVAAVHAGLLLPGEAGVITVEVLAGLSAYEGAERNGVKSLPYGAWDVSYQLTGVEPLDSGVTLPNPGDLSTYRGQDGLVLKFEVTGDADGSIWGDDVYTDDSSLATAAVHAGVLKPGETGIVSVEILPGQPSYPGVERNGIASKTYQSWNGSYRVLPPLGSKVSGKLSN